jgi:phage terminase small subunit
MPPKPKLSPKQERFVAEYLIDCNATDAAKRAGYSERSAKQIGHELLLRPAIKAAVDAAQARRAEKAGITQEWVLDNLRSVATRCMVGGNDFNPTGANRALELLGKHLGMFIERHGGPDGGPIQVQAIEWRIVDPKAKAK